MKIQDFNESLLGQLVVYMPSHSKTRDGKINFSVCEQGRVTSYNSKFVFVKFNEVRGIGIACLPENLILFNDFVEMKNRHELIEQEEKDLEFWEKNPQLHGRPISVIRFSENEPEEVPFNELTDELQELVMLGEKHCQYPADPKVKIRNTRTVRKTVSKKKSIMDDLEI